MTTPSTEEMERKKLCLEIRKLSGKLATSEQIDDLVRINTNICAINTIRRELENIYLSDEEQFSGHIEKINKLLDEMAEDEINLFDAIKAESTE